jgi:hypothetical protein
MDEPDVFGLLWHEPLMSFSLCTRVAGPPF